MDNLFDVMSNAMSRAREARSACKQYARQMATFIRGNLRECDTNDLIALKKELRDFNMQTGKWKKDR